MQQYVKFNLCNQKLLNSFALNVFQAFVHQLITDHRKFHLEKFRIAVMICEVFIHVLLHSFPTLSWLSLTNAVIIISETLGFTAFVVNAFVKSFLFFSAASLSLSLSLSLSVCVCVCVCVCVICSGVVPAQ